MRITRIATEAGACLARVTGDVVEPVVAGLDIPGHDPLRAAIAEGIDLATAPAIADPIPLDDARLLAPVAAPQKVLAVGLNYADHAREAGQEPPVAPVIFAKTPNSIIGPGAPIHFTKANSSEVDYEAELAVVIGRTARDVTADAALRHVLGYTACNDVSARDVQLADGQWVRGKSFDTFCPLGPWIVTVDDLPDPQALRIGCRLNGMTVQDSTTAEMIFGVAEIVSRLSRVMTLEPGDVIATGTPPGVGYARTPPLYLCDGDVVEVDIEIIGVLRNPVEIHRSSRLE